MAWTRWRKIAQGRHFFSEELDWDGPACYELALAGPRGGNLRIVYVGETVNERSRVIAYASHGSHLSKIIANHLRRGWCLFYRAQAKGSKFEAVCMQNSLLSKFDYDWNILLNGK
jgi:hypothetical protein